MRAEDSRLLLEARHFDGAYYLAGYAVECGLKACIAKGFKQDDIPDPALVKQIYTHDLTKLLEHAGIRQNVRPNSPLDVSWGIVRQWSEQARYELGTTELEANEMFNAVNDAANGVLPWLKLYW